MAYQHICTDRDISVRIQMALAEVVPAPSFLVRSVDQPGTILRDHEEWCYGIRWKRPYTHIWVNHRDNIWKAMSIAGHPGVQENSVEDWHEYFARVFPVEEVN